MLLPRGSGGRTPTVTELERPHRLPARRCRRRCNLEAFIDLFNMFNQQDAVLTDDNYTYELGRPIVNGTPIDLKYAKDICGRADHQEPELRPRRCSTSARSTAASACA